MEKIAVIANKNWETEPMLAAMFSGEFRPAGLPFPDWLLSNQDSRYRVDASKVINDPANARAIFRFHPAGDAAKPVILEVKVWCIQDFMDLAKNSSSSEEKFRFLPSLINLEAPDLVIAFGTAGYLSDTTYAGSVVIGSRFFVHNGHPGNPASNLADPRFETLLPTTVNPKLFGVISPAFKLKCEPKFLRTPVDPTSRAACLASPFYTAVGSVNVTDYNEYAWVDAEAIATFRSVEKKLPVGSLETTHGVIRLSTDRPIIFVSAITDREGNFDMEVTPGQNYVASFNGGLVMGQLLLDLNTFLSANPAFDLTQVID